MCSKQTTDRPKIANKVFLVFSSLHLLFSNRTDSRSILAYYSVTELGNQMQNKRPFFRGKPFNLDFDPLS